MKLISWNVNGIRSILKKGFLDFLKKENPDVLSLQETRSQEEASGLSVNGFRQYWNVCEGNRGYSGTAILTRIEPNAISVGMRVPSEKGTGRRLRPVPFSDPEGRMLTAEYEKFFLVNVYTPNSKRDLSRLNYRQEWDLDFFNFLKKLGEKKPVIFCGDLNVAHKERDLTHPQANRKNHGFTDEERAGFDRFVKNGFIDTFREFVEEGGHYTWWSQFANCRARDIGWRIDYFCISASLRPYLKDAFILPDVMGSDHCPVGIEIDLP
jgi:exodeoxyribonuclease-3